MKYLILVRHGDTDRGGSLSRLGEMQLKSISAKLKIYVTGVSGCILTSTAPRAFQSAEILKTNLNLTLKECDVLFADNFHFVQKEKVYSLVKEHREKFEVLILVTHHDYTRDFPNFYSQNEWKKQIFSPPIGQGQAMIIDCEGMCFKNLLKPI